MLGTAGHVDHGKTALVKLLTGCETDTLAEEQKRGLTIDLGFAPCRLADQRVVGVVDVPGHVDFIRNMVAGAHGIDVVVLVVAADDGIMPQTHEHLHILTLMGLHHGVVALTKIDLVDAARRESVRSDLRQLLSSTFLADAPICPMSNRTGEGYGEFFDALNEVVAACGDRSSMGLFRLWVEDAFTIRGAGTVVTGIPSGGQVRVGDSLVLLPGSRRAQVRQMQVYGQDATEGRAGECVALNLPDLDHLAVRRGMVLSAPGTQEPIAMAEAELRILEGVKGQLDDFFEAHLHIGTASGLARIALLESTVITAGQSQMVQLRLAEPLPIVPGERYVLRANLGAHGQSGLTTVGGGRILGVSNARLRRKRPWTLRDLMARREALDDPGRWCELVLRESRRPLTSPELESKCRLRMEEMAALLERLRSEGRVTQLAGGALAHPAAIAETKDKILAAIEDLHATHPQRAGLSPQELFARADQDPELCALAAESLVRSKQIEFVGAVYARAGWSARLSDRDQRVADQIGAAFQASGFAGPSSEDISQSLGQPRERVEQLIGLLCERGILVRLDPRAVVHRDALEAAKMVALRLFTEKPLFSTMAFRDALGVSRKYAVPLLDFLDKTRFTVRSGHDRTPGVEARKLANRTRQPM